MNSSIILDLFRETGIENPTGTQTGIAAALLAGKIRDKKAFLEAGIETAESIQRWRGMEGIMKTVDTVWEHQNRVKNMIHMCQYVIGTWWIDFDLKKASFMARHHDMTEWLSPFGDIPTPLKRRLSPESASLLKKVEFACLEILSSMDSGEYGMNPNEIRESLIEMENKVTPEAQMVKYFDLLDAYMMSIHEYCLWTTDFLDRAEWYRAVFQEIHRGEYLPYLKQLQKSVYQNIDDHSPIEYLLDVNTLSKLEINSNILIHWAAYNFWKVHIARL